MSIRVTPLTCKTSILKFCVQLRNSWQFFSSHSVIYIAAEIRKLLHCVIPFWAAPLEGISTFRLYQVIRNLLRLTHTSSNVMIHILPFQLFCVNFPIIWSFKLLGNCMRFSLMVEITNMMTSVAQRRFALWALHDEVRDSITGATEETFLILI